MCTGGTRHAYAGAMRESSPEYQMSQRGLLREGTRIGPDLTVIDVLGEGGTGVVYRAQHAVLRREVAVKMSKVSGPLAAEARARLVREARMCASIRDSHVPRIYALAELEDGTPFIVMEKAEGTTLSHTLASRRLAVKEACALGCELLDALAAVHRKGIVHRDIKPSNLMVHLKEGAPLKLRLLDFGVGKVVSTSELDLPALTCRGELLGTPLYMAPEQILAQPIDARADLYSAGVVIYEMLAGRTPFEGDSVGAVFASVLRDEIVPLASLRPNLPASLLTVVRNATAKQAEHRYADARAMREALGTALKEVHALGDAPGFDGAEHESLADLSPTLVYKSSFNASRAAADNRHRTISLSLARTVRVLTRDGAAEPSGVLKLRPRVGFRVQRDALALDSTLADRLGVRS